jgi:hypothetical protein
MEKDLTTSQKLMFIKKLNKIDNDGRDLMYVLIRMYDNAINKASVLNVPYEGSISKDGLLFDLEKFPLKLKRLLYKFVGMHLSAMAEQKILEEYRCNSG